ncbi:MAG: hypothetical protein ACC662_06515 [Planctomycetota bacterium]
MNLFLVYTEERGGGGGTLGFDYEYRVSERVGIGPFVDYVRGNLDALALGAGVFLHPCEGLGLYVAPGIDISHAVEEDGERAWRVKPLVRVGAFYELEVGRGFALSPATYLDFIGGTDVAWIVGLNVTRGWR